MGRGQQAARRWRFCNFSTASSKTGPLSPARDYTVADITAMVAVDFMRVSRLAVPDTLTNLKRWHWRSAARPSAAA